MSDFQQTVDLKDHKKSLHSLKAKPKKALYSTGTKSEKLFNTKKKPVIKRVSRPKQKNAIEQEKSRREKRNSDIDEVYDNHDEVAVSSDLQTFNKPKFSNSSNNFYKNATVVLIGALLLMFFYYNFYQKIPLAEVNNEIQVDSGWYAVKLVNDQTYYGQVSDKTADPVVVKNVYYNYDQLNKEADTVGDSGNLRLVKRGKETYGPDGSMDIIRSQVVYIEPLKQDSKVLKAILDYEK